MTTLTEEFLQRQDVPDEAVDESYQDVRTIRGKLLGAFFVVIALTVVISLIALRNQQDTSAAIRTLINAQTQSEQLDLDLLRRTGELERIENSLLLTAASGSTSERDVQFTNWQQAYSRLNAQIDLLETAGIGEGSAMADIQDLLRAYRQTFLATADSVQNFQDQVRVLNGMTELLNALSDTEYPDLRLAALELVSVQKQYVASRDLALVDEYNAKFIVFASMLANHDTVTNQERTQFQDQSNAMSGAFLLLTQVDQTLRENTFATEQALTLLNESIHAQAMVARETSIQLSSDLQTQNSNNTRDLLPFVIGTVVIGLVAAWLIGSSMFRQIQALRSTVEAVDAGDFTARSEITADDELGVVAIRLNELLDNNLALVQSEQAQQDFQMSVMTLLDDITQAAEGDLTIKTTVDHPRLVNLANALNMAIGQLRTVIDDVQTTTVQFSAAAGEIQTTSEHLTRGSELQAEQLVDTSAAIDEMAVSVQQVSENSALSSTIASQARANAQTGSVMTRETVKKMEQIRERVVDTAAGVQRLGDATQDVSDILTLIDEIADRTSVLALNATIRALAAGKAGRGFAVVAREIEQLADQSTSATARVTRLSETIRADAVRSVDAMNRAVEQVNRGTALATNAGQQLEAIEAVSNQLETLIGQIAIAAQQQANSSETVARAMSEIAEVTQQTAAGTREANHSIGNLARLAEDLRASITIFKIDQSDGHMMAAD